MRRQGGSCREIVGHVNTSVRGRDHILDISLLSSTIPYTFINYVLAVSISTHRIHRHARPQRSAEHRSPVRRPQDTREGRVVEPRRRPVRARRHCTLSRWIHWRRDAVGQERCESWRAMRLRECYHRAADAGSCCCARSPQDHIHDLDAVPSLYGFLLTSRSTLSSLSWRAGSMTCPSRFCEYARALGGLGHARTRSLSY